MLHRISGGLAALLLLNACQQYDFSVNDKIVYTPHPLFSDFAAVDPALQDCLRSAIEDRKITQVTQLQELSCSGDGIEKLTGLAVFTGLRQLDLTDNAISDIAELASLGGLEEVYLNDNQIVDPLPLAGLQALDTVDLSDNKGLRCPDRQALLRVGRLRLPTHCS